MTWLLDTNVVSEPTKRAPSAEVLRWLDAQDTTSLYTLSLAIAELRSGLERVTDPKWRTELAQWIELRVRPMFAGRVLDADEPVWMAMLLIAERAKAAKRTVPVTDLVFAAVAERHGMIIVTRNVRHFAGTGVRVLNPWLPDPVAVVM